MIQHYAWGGKHFIPQLIQKQNPNKQPFAELWMGTHVKGPSTLKVGRKEVLLREVIQDNPRKVLGKPIIKKFGEQLPFLFKVLDVQKMLSIQAHPTKKEAEIGFAKEEESGISRIAPNRTYRDDNHKPEVMIALTEFWLLHGFKAIGEIQEVLERTAFQPLQKYFSNNNVFSLYKAIMDMPQSEVDQLLEPLAQQLPKQLEEDQLSKNQADYWAAQAFNDYTIDGHYDRGIFSIYLFNLVRLKRGEGIFQDAGIPHAYLEGVNIELMANSDNVFRGGLTQKFINVPELLKHLVFESVSPKILVGAPISNIEKVYKTPAPDFELSQLKISQKDIYRPKQDTSLQIIIAIEGEGMIISNSIQLPIKPGDSFFIEPNIPYKILPKTDALLFKARVPV